MQKVGQYQQCKTFDSLISVYMTDVVQLVCKNLDLGIPTAYFFGSRGVTHKKTKIVTNKGTFFVKCYMDVADSELRYIHDVEIFMHSKGIPVPQPVNVTGALWLRLGNLAYKAYYFIDSVSGIKNTEQEYGGMGALLARIHWAGSQDIPRSVLSREASYPRREKLIVKLRDMFALLESKNDNSVAAKSVKDHLRWKLSLAQTFSKDILPVKDAVLHGDFHLGNMLFSDTGTIVGICDWDRANFGSRTFELLSSVYLCCYRLENTRADALRFARAMVKGYHSEYPITVSELQDELRSLMYVTVLNTALEKEYVERNRFDIEKLIAVERGVVEFCLDASTPEKLLAKEV